MAQSSFDVVVIGEGISGLSAAHALAQSGLRTATLEAQLFGGLVLNVNELNPAPDPSHSVSGAEIASELMQANADLGVVSIQEAATGIRDRGATKQITTAAATYEARQIVVASGARLKKLDVPGETEYEGRGVSQCADCDGPMYQDEAVLVVGGGDSALQEALVLAKYCGKVHIVHRGTAFRAQRHFVEQVNASPRISTIWNAQVKSIAGAQMVERVEIGHADGIETIPCAGVFAYIGLAPNTDFLPRDIERDEAGHVITRGALETALPGVWAVGAVRSGYSGLLPDAVSEAKQAARTIIERLA